MMNYSTTAVLLFPGQGGFDGTALAYAHRDYPQVPKIFDDIDTVTSELYSRRLSDYLFGERPPRLRDLLSEEPWVSQLAIYGSGLAAHGILHEYGLPRCVLMGHSLGEITALVAGGVFSVPDGARLIAQRTALIHEQSQPGDGMTAVSASPQRVAHLVGVIAHPQLSVAAENHDSQIVVGGPTEALEDLHAVADHLRISTVRLDTPFAFHNPSLTAAGEQFAEFVRGYDQRPLHTPVYSPILERYYEPDEDFGVSLAQHFTLPVRFSTAIQRRHVDGHRVFIEVGGHTALSAATSRQLRETAEVTVLSTLTTGKNAEPALEETLTFMRQLKPDVEDSVPDVEELRKNLAADAPANVFREFWSVHGHEIVADVASRLGEFRARTGVDAPTAAPTNAEVEERQGPSGGMSASCEGDGDATGVTRHDRDELLSTVRTTYATALEYPEEVLTSDALLEAELGVDSVKQVELLSRVSRHYELPERPDTFRLDDYDTLGKIADLIQQELAERQAAGVVV